jgi:hypothetical protein
MRGRRCGAADTRVAGPIVTFLPVQVQEQGEHDDPILVKHSLGYWEVYRKLFGEG